MSLEGLLVFAITAKLLSTDTFKHFIVDDNNKPKFHQYINSTTLGIVAGVLAHTQRDKIQLLERITNLMKSNPSQRMTQGVRSSIIGGVN